MRWRLYLLLFVCSWTVVRFGYSQTAASLGFELPSSIYQIDQLIQKDRLDQALPATQKLLQTSTQPRSLAFLWYSKAEIYYQLNELDQAQEDLMRADSLFQLEKDLSGMALVRNKLGSIALANMENETAGQYFQAAIKLLPTQNHPELLLDIYQNQALQQNMNEAPQAAIGCLKKGLHISRKLKKQAQTQTILNNIATSYYAMSMLDSAVVYFRQLIELKQKSTSDPSLINDWSTLGKLYEERGEYVQAQEQLIEALRLSESQQDTFQMMSLCTDLARVYAAQQNWNLTFEYSAKGYQLARQKGLAFTQAQNLKIQAMALQQQGQKKAAIEVYQEALQLFQSLNNVINVADIQVQLSQLHPSESQLRQAQKDVKRALRLRLGSGDRMGLLQTRLMLGELELRLQHHQQAINYLEQALQSSLDMNNLGAQRTASQILAKAYAQEGNFQKAYLLHQQYALLNDSLLSLERSKAINELDILYKTEQKDKQLLANSAEIEQQQAKIQQRNMALVALLILVGLLIVSAILLYFIYRKNKQLSQQKLEVLQQQQESQRLRAIIEGEEKERKRIARELHDGLGATLATVKMRINAIENDLPEANQLQSYQKAGELLDDACAMVRGLSHNMVPGILEHYGLQYAINDMCEAIAKASEMEVDFIHFGFDRELSDTMSVTIYRIVQELLRNIVQHAEASEVIVQLTVDQDRLNLTVEDNGKGFDPKAPGFQKGLGLNNVFSRVKYLGGDIQIEASPQTGSSFIIDIPNLQYA